MEEKIRQQKLEEEKLQQRKLAEEQRRKELVSCYTKGLPLSRMSQISTIFLWLKGGVYSIPKQSKNLDLSFKTDLGLWDCLGKVKLVL